MKVLSLFDGMGGTRDALNTLGVEVEQYLASEIDPYAMRVAQSNYRDIIEIGDIRKLDVRDFPQDIDLIVAGSPCTQLSKAGNDRSGLEGEDSRLFYYFLGIRNSVPHKYYLLENVASMTNQSRDLITDLMEVEPIMIDSQLLTAQRRKRLYWTNIPNIEQPKDLGITLDSILEEDFNPKLILSEAELEYMNRANKKGENRWIYKYHSDSWEGKSSTVVANFCKGVPNNVLIDRRYGVVRKFSPVECERLQGFRDNYTSLASNTQRYKMLGNGFTSPVISHILSYME